MKRLIIIALLFLKNSYLKATEVYICKYSYNGDYSCELISEKSNSIEKTTTKPLTFIDFSTEEDEEVNYEEDLETM